MVKVDGKEFLLEWAQKYIEPAKRLVENNPDDVSALASLRLYEIALASINLMSKPVFQERRYQFIGKKELEYWADVDRGVYLNVPESERRIIYVQEK